MFAVLFPIVRRDPKWDRCFICGKRSDYIAAMKRSDEDAEVRSPICESCADEFLPDAAEA